MNKGIVGLAALLGWSITVGLIGTDPAVGQQVRVIDAGPTRTARRGRHATRGRCR